jgi:glycosyltransferase involved in cell wall biosynthesis
MPPTPPLPCLLSVVPRAYLPVLRGGLEITAAASIEALIGYPVRGVVAASAGMGAASLSARIRRRVSGPYHQRYEVRRHQVYTDIWHPAGLHVLVSRLKPSAAICHVSGAEIVSTMVSLDLPTLFYVHDAYHVRGLEQVKHMRSWRVAAESSFIADRIADVIGQPVEIIRPMLEPAAHDVTSSGDAVLAVNPHPLKGGRMIVDVARSLPHRRFLVVGGWGAAVPHPELAEIERALAGLENVERVGHVEDIRLVFRRSRCLLMPVVVEEAFGRTAAEALLAGIPVVASDRGALPETVGGGGVTLPYDAPVSTWAAAVERLFVDDGTHAHFATRAREQAREASRQPAYVRRQLINVMADLLTTGGAVA